MKSQLSAAEAFGFTDHLVIFQPPGLINIKEPERGRPLCRLQPSDEPFDYCNQKYSHPPLRMFQLFAEEYPLPATGCS